MIRKKSTSRPVQRLSPVSVRPEEIAATDMAFSRGAESRDGASDIAAAFSLICGHAATIGPSAGQNQSGRVLLQRGATIPICCATTRSKGLTMSDSGSAYRNAYPDSVPPHSLDPWLYPELFRGVLTRRLFAFLVDLVVLSIAVVLVCLFIALFGVVTLGLGWTLFWLISPASVIWALVY